MVINNFLTLILRTILLENETFAGKIPLTSPFIMYPYIYIYILTYVMVARDEGFGGGRDQTSETMTPAVNVTFYMGMKRKVITTK